MITNLPRFLERRKAGLIEEYSSLGYTPQPVERPVEQNQVVINEIAAVLRDENYESTGDWIELYNNTVDIIPLSRFWLSDSIPAPFKFNFPYNAAIKPSGFVTVKADNKVDKDGLHAGFKLAAEGEEVLLFHELYGTMDSLIYGQQYPTLTYGRYPDGTGSFITMVPTPNSTNVMVLDIDNKDMNGLTNEFTVYPNPANSVLNIRAKRTTEIFDVALYNFLGTEVLKENSIRSSVVWDISDLNRGVYLLKITTGNKAYSDKIILR